MLDDASDKGLLEALRFLPVSSAGRGLLLTSHKIKPDDFFNLLGSRDDSKAASVETLECCNLDEATAQMLFHERGFKLEPANSVISDAISQELKVSLFILNKP
jgi:hypothetical protein